MLPVLFQISLGFGGFQQMIQNMTNLGFFQFLFPFLLALAIFYGILMWAFKEKMPRSAVGLISLILAFFVMLFASANPSLILFLQNISGTGLIVGTGILFLIILLGLTGFNISDLVGAKKSAGERLLLLLIIAIVIVLFFGAGTSFLLPSVSVGSDFWTIIFFVIIFAVVLWFLGREEGGGGKGGAPAGGGGGGRPG